MAASVVISAVVLSGIFLAFVAPQMWWLVTIYGWVVFPAFGTLTSGLGGGRRVSEGKFESVPHVETFESRVSAEQQILEALARNGELTPTRAALETSLSVSEAGKLLAGLAKEGHLEVRVRDGGIFYSMWNADYEGEIEAR